MAVPNVLPLELSASKKYGPIHEGVRQDSTDLVAKLLRENHEQFHIYFHPKGFHNHIVHHLLCIYSMGATPEEIQRGYDQNKIYQVDAIVHSDADVDKLGDRAEFKAAVGNPDKYNDFVRFFTREIKAKGVPAVLNEYVFAGDERANDMLARLLGGILHPIIHLGYGLEFDLPPIVAEGLAETAIHPDEAARVCGVAEKIAASRPRKSGVSLVSLQKRIAADPSLSSVTQWEGPPNKLADMLIPRAGEKLAEVLADYAVDPQDLERRTAESINVIAYTTAAAQRPGKVPMFDFFLMHALNSAYFLSVFMEQSGLSVETKCRLLEWKARFDLTVIAANRSAKLYPERITEYQPKKPGDWESIFRRATAYDDDGHAAKVIRALKNAERVTKPYDGSPEFPLRADDCLTVAHMVMDSVERMHEPGYKLPPVPPFILEMPTEVHRTVARWSRWCGFEQAWAAVPDLPQAKV